MKRDYPKRVTVTIEIPRWSFVKYSQHATPSDANSDSAAKTGYVDFVSPLPCPYNYGFVADNVAADGMELDAIVCGQRLKRWTQVELPVRAVILFVDAGRIDDKLVCHSKPLGLAHFIFLRTSFHVYVAMKRFLNWYRGTSGETRYNGMIRIAEDA